MTEIESSLPKRPINEPKLLQVLEWFVHDTAPKQPTFLKRRYDFDLKEFINYYYKFVEDDGGAAIWYILTNHKSIISYLEFFYKKEIEGFAEKDPNKQVAINFLPYHSDAMMPYYDMSSLPSEYHRLLKTEGMVQSSFIPMKKSQHKSQCNTCKKIFLTKRRIEFCGECNAYLTQKGKEEETIIEFELMPMVDGKYQESQLMPCFITAKERGIQLINFEEVGGKKVRLCGYLFNQKIIKKTDSPYNIKHLFAVVGFEVIEEIKVTDKDIKQIDQFISENNETLIKTITSKIFPSIIGYQDEKELLLLNCFGMQRQPQSHQMCCLILGDAGKGKTTMVRQILKYFPNSQFVLSHSSKAGLVFSVVNVKDKGYAIRYGAIPKADNSVCAFDEVNRIPEQIGTIQSSISDKQAKTDKVVTACMDIHVNFILVANPSTNDMVFDRSMNLLNQINIPPPLIDRSDAILIFDQSPSVEIISKYIDILDHDTTQNEEIPFDYFIQKLLYYKKKAQPNPSLDQQAKNHLNKRLYELVDMYNKWMRNQQGFETTKLKIEYRKVTSVFKFASAYARLHNRTRITVEDVDYVFGLLFRASYKKLFDVAGVSSYQEFGVKQKQIKVIRNKNEIHDEILYFISYKKQKKQDAKHSYVIDHLKEKGVPAELSEKIIKMMLESGEIMNLKYIAGEAYYEVTGGNLKVPTEYVEEQQHKKKATVKDWLLNQIESTGELGELEAKCKTDDIDQDEMYQIIDQLKTEGEITEKMGHLYKN